MGQLDDRPPWAMSPAVALRYDEAMRRLVFAFDESVATARVFLEHWHTRELARTRNPGCAAAPDFFRDFWPWYIHSRS